MDLRRVRLLIWKEFLQLRRDRAMLPIIFILPALQLLMFGYVVGADVRNLPTAVVDLDRTSLSRQVPTSFSASGYFDIVARPRTEADIRPLMDSNRIQVALVVPEGFSERIARRQPAQVLVVVDGSDSKTASVAQGYATAILANLGPELNMSASGGSPGAGSASGGGAASGGAAGGATGSGATGGGAAGGAAGGAGGGAASGPNPLAGSGAPAGAGAGVGLIPGTGGVVDARVRVLFNPSLEAVNTMVPGLIATVLLISMSATMSQAVVKERERGTLEQLFVTPIRRDEYLLGKLTPYIIVATLQISVIVTLGLLWFRVPFRGDPLVLGLGILLFMIMSIGQALLISMVSRTRVQAQQAVVFIMIPSMLLSGFIFPIESMPPSVQLISYAIPLRYVLVVMRSSFMKGSGLIPLLPQFAAMALFSTAIFGFALAQFRKKLAD